MGPRTIRCHYAGRTGVTGLGKPLKSITHPLRPDIPIFLGAEGPKNVAMSAEIAAGLAAALRGPPADRADLR